MDSTTLGAYDRDAAVFAEQWHEQPPPDDLRAALLPSSCERSTRPWQERSCC
ncbi:hypothetical protein P3T35_006602 [Kitasatospora sp. GP30]|uniref:hypothetical protein n=1 Tax=Kitasatospora sp. GP30 TaxID=3035084 RepID=UPI0024734664|nr:hypothetical protein [Kitasatospora sp. GP30]MDH6144559.1 hypothetical protein [Kitasatospora sp. GP30]